MHVNHVIVTPFISSQALHLRLDASSVPKDYLLTIYTQCFTFPHSLIFFLKANLEVSRNFRCEPEYCCYGWDTACLLAVFSVCLCGRCGSQSWHLLVSLSKINFLARCRSSSTLPFPWTCALCSFAQSKYMGSTWTLPKIDNYFMINCNETKAHHDERMDAKPDAPSSMHSRFDIPKLRKLWVL